MAKSQPHLRVLSIGCSCINRFQFNFFLERHPEYTAVFPRGLFDWNIASLDATLTVLRLIADRRLEDVFEDDARFHVAWDALILHRDLPGLSFYHEETPHDLLADQDRRSAFISKLNHLSRPFVAPDPNTQTLLVWSNLQPNLPDTVENVIPWEEFILNEARYDETLSLGRRIFGQDTDFLFLTTPQDTELSPEVCPDMRIVDLPRGDTFQGDPRLYEDILTKVVRNTN